MQGEGESENRACARSAGEGEKVADRRMFAKTIIDSDAFLDMPSSTQALYFHLGMRADDEGFINNAKKIQRVVGASDDDLKLLIAKRFVIPFETGIIVIKHWKIHNYIRKDRLKETVYQAEKALLSEKENGSYTICQPTVNQLSTECQHRLGKDRLGKDSIGKVNNIADKPQKFKPPTLEEVTAYCKERNNSVNPQQFIDHYTANGWYRGKTKIKDWRACVRTWEKNTRQQGKADVFDEARKILEAEQNDGQ